MNLTQVMMIARLLCVCWWAPLLVRGKNDQHKRFVAYLDGYYTWSYRVDLLRALYPCAQPVPPAAPLQYSDVLTFTICDDVNASTTIVSGPGIRHIKPDYVLRASPKWTARKLQARGAPFDMFRGHRHHEVDTKQLHVVLHAHYLWDRGITGKDVRVAIFDTGLPPAHPHFRFVHNRIDWTDERSADDFVGHGTFVASIIAGTYRSCPGLAPDAQLHIYKVFNKMQLSYTSWFLDAFNHAIQSDIDVLNLSIGGPDFTDQPFMDKVAELAANGIALVSAIGNDGPMFGTLNNPADQLDAIGVGAVNWSEQIAKYSSRGMTTWELPGGYGRMKPDLVTYGTMVQGSSLSGSCRQLSGTSVASPVVTAAIALLISAARQEHKTSINVAVIKQVLMASARRLPPPAIMYEQGAGLLSLVAAYELLVAYKPQASLSPPFIDTLDCPYSWPHCTQPLYADSLPVLLNVTIINGANVHSTIANSPVWYQYTNGSSRARDVLRMAFTWSHEVWPYAGWLGVWISVHPSAINEHSIITGRIELTLNTLGHMETLKLPVRVLVIPRPLKTRRILWDQYRQQNYPPGYVPRDDLLDRKDPLDWHGDHPHTNYKTLYHHLRLQGFYIEISGQPLTCIDKLADRYGTLLVVDPEEEYYLSEIQHLRTEVDRGLSIVVFADWYNASVMHHIGFNDDNTRGWWEPVVGGANVPALNRLLGQWHMALTDQVVQGNVSLFGGHHVHMASGATIRGLSDKIMFHQVDCCLFDQGDHLLAGGGAAPKQSVKTDTAVFALSPPVPQPGARSTGFVAVFGDSNCLTPSSAYRHNDCYWLVDSLLELVNLTHSQLDFTNNSVDSTVWSPLAWLRPSALSWNRDHQMPEYAFNSSFANISRVISAIETPVDSGNLTGDAQRVRYKRHPTCVQPDWVKTLPIHNYTMPENMAASFKLLSIDQAQWPLQQWNPPANEISPNSHRLLHRETLLANNWMKMYSFSDQNVSILPALFVIIAIVTLLLVMRHFVFVKGRRRSRVRRFVAAVVRKLNW